MSTPIETKSHQTNGAIATIRKVTSRLDISWVIEDYFTWAGTVAKSDKVLSHPFKLIEKGSDTIHEFMLRIDPHGNNKDAEGYISVCMCYRGPKKALKCEYEVNIQKSNGELLPLMIQKGVKNLDELEKLEKLEKSRRILDGLGHDKALLISKLEKEKDQLLPHGTLVFVGHVQLTTFENEYSNASKFLLKENLEAEIPLTALLRKSFEEDEGNFSDFIIICNNGKEKRSFNVHKVIIAAGSPVLMAMLRSVCSETSSNSVTVSDISPSTMHKILHFLYTDSVEAADVDTDLLSAANKYQMNRLKAFCEFYLIDELEESTAVHLAVISDLYGSELFKKEVAKFLGENWLKIKQTKDIDTLKNYPDLMLRIMSYYT